MVGSQCRRIDVLAAIAAEQDVAVQPTSVVNQTAKGGTIPCSPSRFLVAQLAVGPALDLDAGGTELAALFERATRPDP
jgi:hypothetical protein